MNHTLQSENATRVAQAETRTAQARTGTQQDATQVAQAVTRSQQDETRKQQAKTGSRQNLTQTEQAQTQTQQDETRTQQARTGSQQDVTQAEQAQTRTEQDDVQRLNDALELRVAERTAQLKTANEELEAFSYSVSHDLRAPLRHVMGFVNLLQKDAASSLSEKNLKYLTTISDSAKRMGDLIDDLLDFSRVGRAVLNKTSVPLDQLVQETLNDFREETKERKIIWEIWPLPTVCADRALLQLVLVNLISNALKFTSHRAEAKIEIVSAPGQNGETVIFIRDNGAGFDPSYAHKLFGVFQRLHSNAEFEGTGIGLANVQRIIHRHGGRVWAEGSVDGGATFYFSIPKQINGDIDEH
jgi:light-regulated signal transduction histidine kinase (bacteriophytochrome)